MRSFVFLELWASIVALLLLPGAALSQTSSPSFSADCLVIAPGVGASTSSTFSAVTVVGATLAGETMSPGFTARFTSMCPDLGSGGCVVPLCGDCDLNLTVNILDALQAAKHAVGLIVLVGLQFDSCDVDNDPDVDVIDSLFIAQASAGLPVTLTCC